jgi:glycerol uptake facilitator-like aquaporin
MFSVYVAEAVGSFVFFVIVLSKGEPVKVAVALLIGILIATIASQGHLNPGISAMAYMQGKFTADETIGYVAAQLIAAIAAVYWFNYYESTIKLIKT